MTYSRPNKLKGKPKSENNILVNRNAGLTAMLSSSVRENCGHEDEAWIGSTIIQRHKAWQQWKAVIWTLFRATHIQSMSLMGIKNRPRRTCSKQEKNESRIRQFTMPIVTKCTKRGLPKSEGRKAMTVGPEYLIWQRSLHSTQSKGKPCTRGREAVNNFSTNKGYCVRQ